MPSAVGPMKRKIEEHGVVDQRLEEVPLEDGEDLVVVLEADPVDVAEPDPLPVGEGEQDRGDRRDPDQPDVQDGRDSGHRQHDPAVAPVELPAGGVPSRLARGCCGRCLGSGLRLPRLLPRFAASEGERARRRIAGGRARRLLREDRLGLGLHVFEDASRCSRDRTGSRRRPGPATFEANSGLASRSRNWVTVGAAETASSDLLLQRRVDRLVDVGRRRRSRSGPSTGRPPAPRRCRSGRGVPWRPRRSSGSAAIIQPSIGASIVSVPNSGFISGQGKKSRSDVSPSGKLLADEVADGHHAGFSVDDGGRGLFPGAPVGVLLVAAAGAPPTR